MEGDCNITNTTATYDSSTNANATACHDSNRTTTIPTTSKTANACTTDVWVPENSDSVICQDLLFKSDADKWRYVNNALCQSVIPEVLRVVIDWGCDKPADLTFLEYFAQLWGQKEDLQIIKKENVNNITNQGNKQNKKKEKKKPQAIPTIENKIKKDLYLKSYCLNLFKLEKTTDQFDVQGLYSIIQGGCKNLADCNSSEWQNNSESIESLIYQCKEIRNQVAHLVTTVAISDTLHKTIYKILIDILKKAGNLYNISEEDIKSKINILNSNMENILKYTKKEAKLAEIRRRLRTQGTYEMREIWKSRRQNLRILFLDNAVPVAELFYPTTLRRHKIKSRQDESIPQTLDISQILSIWPGRENNSYVRIIEGEVGSGKTFMMTMIALNFLKIVDNSISEVERYDSLIYMECKNSTLSSFKSLIKYNYPNFSRSYNIDEIEEALSAPVARNLYLIDGVDEMHNNTNQTFEEILERISNEPSSLFIFSSRPHEVDFLKRQLSSKTGNIQHCKLQELISLEDQLDFLKRYESAFPSKNFISLCDEFKKLDIYVRYYFRYALHLVYFYHLFVNKPENITKWTGEKDVASAMLDMSLKVMKEKLQLKCADVINFENCLYMMVNKLSEYAARSFFNGKMCISQDEYQKLIQECSDKINSKIPYKNALSNILLATDDFCDEVSNSDHYFIHRYTFEYLTMRFVMQKYITNNPINENTSLREKTILCILKDFVTDIIMNSESSDKVSLDNLKSLREILDKALLATVRVNVLKQLTPNLIESPKQLIRKFQRSPKLCKPETISR